MKNHEMFVACLMAGTCSRLLPRTKRDHKAMLSLGALRVIDAQMKTFSMVGLDTFSFVVGHGGARLSEHLLKNYSDAAISIINNNHFDVRNLDWSAYLALSSQSGDVFYYEGDLVVAPSVIKQLIDDNADVCVAMDPVGRSTRIDTRVIAKNGRIRQLVFAEHGDLTAGNDGTSDGEFLCCVKLSDCARRYVVARLATESYSGPMKLYDIFNELFESHSSFLVSTAGRPWIEIDDHSDLKRAEKIVPGIIHY